MFNFFRWGKRVAGNGFFYFVGLLSFFLGVNVWWVLVDNRVPYNDPPWHFVSSLRIYELFAHFSIEKMRDVALCAFNPPFTGIVVRPFYAVFGKNIDGAVIAMNLIFVTLLAAFVYKICLYFSKKPLLSALACGVLLSYPGMLIASRFYLLELPLAAMTTAAFYFLLRTQEFRLTKPAVIFGIISGLAILTKTAYILFIALPFFYLCLKLSTKKQILNCLLALAIGSLIAGFWYIPTQKQFVMNVNLLVVVYVKYMLKIALWVGMAFVLIVVVRWKQRYRKIMNFVVWPLFVILAVVFFMRDYYIMRFFLMHIPGIVNNVMGFSGVLFFLIGIPLVFSMRDKGMLLFWSAALIFVNFSTYLVACLPACALITVLGIGQLRRSLRRWMITLLCVSSAASFIVCTWDFPRLPIQLGFAGREEILFFNRKPMLLFYGPPQPLTQDKDWRFKELFDVLKKDGGWRNRMVWLVSDHTYYNAATLNYLSKIGGEQIYFGHLINNPASDNFDNLIRENKDAYFLDLEGFFYPEGIRAAAQLKAIRNYIAAKRDEFEVISLGRIPDGYTVVLYKRKWIK